MIDFLYSLMDKVGITRGQDKVLHALAGFIVGAVSMYLFGVYSIALVLLAGISKEAYDYYDYGKFDVFDLIATILGGWVGIMLIGAMV